MTDLQQNGRIRKVFELAELRFSRNMERDFCFKTLFHIATETAIKTETTF